MLHVVMKSGNRKTGPIPVTYRTQDSCPPDCPFLNNGCYATGRLFAIPDKHGGKTERALLEILYDKAPEGTAIRHHVSGDIMRDGAIDKPYVEALATGAQARPDLLNIIYTHAWRELDSNPFPFPVNASCETPADIEEAIAKGFEAVITLTGPGDSLLGQTVAGKRVIQCPAETRGTTCGECRLCARSRKSVVAFVPHGTGKAKASTAVAERRDR